MTINIFMHIYIWENAHWGIYAPPPGKSITQFFYFFFHLRCILLQISHQKVFFISISIPGHSGVKTTLTAVSFLKRRLLKIAKPPVLQTCGNDNSISRYGSDLKFVMAFLNR